MSDQDKHQQKKQVVKPQKKVATSVDDFTIQNDEQSVENPFDPTDNFRDMVNDTSGLTGISADYNDQTTPPQNTGPVSQTMSDAKYANSTGQQDDEGVNFPSPTNPLKQEDLSDVDNPSPDEVGEASVSGDAPVPESDDDTLVNEHNAGLRLNEDLEHPQELDIASDVDKAEEYHRTH